MKNLTDNVLEDFILLNKIFKGNISPNWEYCLKNGRTYLFDNPNGIINTLVENDILFINSGTEDRQDFSREMIRFIMDLGHQYDKVYLPTSNVKMRKYMEKQGCKFDEENKIYIRGV